MTQFNVGIIGLGVGEKHIAGFESHPDCLVKKICDFDHAKATEVGNRYPHLQIVYNAEQILDDPEIDIVSIASYDNYHYEQITRGLINNKHLFIEKPLCQFSWQAEEIAKLLNKEQKLKISSNLILRMSPRFKQLKHRIETGGFGQVFYLDGSYDYGRLHKITEGWRGSIDFYSVIQGGAVHIIDLFLWLTGDKAEEVFSFGNNISTQHSGFKYNDFIVSLIKFKSGLIGKVATNFGSVRPHFHALSVYGTEATFINDPGDAHLYYSRDPQIEPEVIDHEYPGVHKGALIYSFVESIINSKSDITIENLVTAEDVFKTMSVCFAMEESMQTGKPVKVKYY